MKTLLTLFLCALLCTLPIALAETDSFSVFPMPDMGDDPFSSVPSPESPELLPPSDSQETGTMRLSVMGKTVDLVFDADPTYSLHQNGYVQASFYAYADDGTLYELYMIFPDNVSTGMTVSTQSCISGNALESGLMLFVYESASEVYAIASQDASAAYPEGSTYAITFDAVASSGDSTTFSGTLSATLVALDDTFNPLYPIDGVSGTFRFAMSLDSSTSGPSDVPEEVPTPNLPGLVTPPDAKKI